MTYFRLLGLCCLAGIGCGNRGGGGDGSGGVRPPGGGDPVSQEQFCDRAAPIICEANLRCCMDATMRYTDAGSCVAAQTPMCEAVFSGAAFRDGRIIWNAEAAGDLIAEFQSAAASCRPTEEADIQAVVTGTVPAGGDCQPTESDFSPALACAPGLRCTFSSSGATCQRAITAGGTCGDGLSCADGLFCNDMSVCEAERPNGAACTFSSECQSFECTDSVCVPDPDEPSGGNDYCLDME